MNRQAYTDLPTNFWTIPDFANVTVTTKELRVIQLKNGGRILAQGYLYDIVAKSLGAGVYKVTLKMVR